MKKVEVYFNKLDENGHDPIKTYLPLYNYLTETFLQPIPEYFKGYITEEGLPHGFCEIIFKDEKAKNDPNAPKKFINFNAYNGSLEGECVFGKINSQNQQTVTSYFNFLGYNFGEKTYSNGRRYVGGLLNFAENGNGVLYYPDGTSVVGTFINKILHGVAMHYNASKKLEIIKVYDYGKVIYEGLDENEISKVLMEHNLDELTQEFYEENNFEKIARIKEALKNIENSIVGQTKAKNLITNNLLLSLICPRENNKPITSMLFTGPTGVGKTEMAKQIAKYIYNKKPFVVDFANFHDSFMTSSLIGSPAGYIGSNEQPEFLKYIQENEIDGGVILFDELDKADTECYNILMRMLDEGEIISAKNESYSVKNFIIIFTTNMTANRSRNLGFANKNENELKQTLSNKNTGLKREQLARINVVAEFENLTKEDNIALIKKAIDETAAKLSSIEGYEIKIKYSSKVLEEILSKIDVDFGVREINRQTTKLVTDKLAEFIRNNEATNLEVTIKSLDEVEIKILDLKHDVIKRLSKKAPVRKNNPKEDENKI